MQNLKSSREDKCISTTWKKPDTGNCEVWYTVKYYGGEELLHEQNISSGEVGASFCNSDKVPKVNITRIVAVSNDTFSLKGEEEVVTVRVAEGAAITIITTVYFKISIFMSTAKYVVYSATYIFYSNREYFCKKLIRILH